MMSVLPETDVFSAEYPLDLFEIFQDGGERILPGCYQKRHQSRQELATTYGADSSMQLPTSTVPKKNISTSTPP